MAMLDFDDDGARLIEQVYATADVFDQGAEVLARLAPASRFHGRWPF